MRKPQSQTIVLWTLPLNAQFIYFWTGLFKAGVKITWVSAKFEFRFESLKSKFSLILSVSKLMIGCS